MLASRVPYEFRRTLTRPTLLIAISIGALVALASAAQAAASGPSPSRMYSGVLEYSGGDYLFEFYAFNAYGTPLAGQVYSVQVTGSGGQPVLDNLSGETGTNGQLRLAAALPEGSYAAQIEAGPQGELGYWSQGASSGQVQIGQLAPGQLVPLLGPIVSALDLPIGFDGQPALQVFFPVANLTQTRGPSVYYALVSPSDTTAPLAPVPPSEAKFLGVLTTSHQSFPLVLTPPSDSEAPTVLLEVFSPNGTLLALDSNTSASSLSFAGTGVLTANVAFSDFSGNMALLVPLLAVVTSISVYARDRSSGVLETTLVRPITPLGLALSRLAAVVAAMLCSVGLGVLVSDALIRGMMGYYVFPSFLTAFVLGSAVAVGFFAAIVFALSHVVRSVLSVLSVGLGLYFVLGIFWSSLTTAIVSATYGPYTTLSSGAAYLKLQFLNPIQYLTLAWGALTNTVPSGWTEYGGSASAYGIGPLSLGLAAIAWVMLPVLLLMWRILNRD